MADSEHMKNYSGPTVTLQQMGDCGLNPFAVQLLAESYSSHPHPKPVSFVFRGVKISLELVGSEVSSGS